MPVPAAAAAAAGEFDEYRADLLQKLEDKLAAQEQARVDKLSA